MENIKKGKMAINIGKIEIGKVKGNWKEWIELRKFKFS